MTTRTTMGDSALPGPPQGQWTVADLAAIKAEEGKQYEIIDGVIYLLAQPHWLELDASGEIFWALRTWSKETNAGMALVEPHVILAQNTAVIPDIVWICHERLAAVFNQDGKLYGAPDLVVEVLPQDTESAGRDRGSKLDAYRRHGVQEYWIVDRFQNQVEVFRITSDSLELAQAYGRQDVLKSPLLPGFECAVASLFLRA